MLHAAATRIGRFPVRHARSLVTRFAAGVVITSCGGTSDAPAAEGITIEDFVGSWSATSMVFTSVTDSSRTLDLIAAGGEYRFTMLDGGRTRSWVEIGEFVDEWDSQITLNAAGDLLTSRPAESTRPTQRLTFVLNGPSLTLATNDVTFDFTMTGAPETPARLVAVFTRTN